MLNVEKSVRWWSLEKVKEHLSVIIIIIIIIYIKENRGP